jgi:hypothetical protein
VSQWKPVRLMKEADQRKALEVMARVLVADAKAEMKRRKKDARPRGEG